MKSTPASSRALPQGATADPVPIGQEVARRTFVDALSLFVGRGRRLSAEGLAAATGIPLSTIKTYQAGLACPTLANLLALMAVLPSEFAGEIMGKIGYGLFPLDPGPLDPHAVLASAARGAAALADALVGDGRIDHREELPVARAARRVGNDLIAFAEQLEASFTARRRGTR